GSWSASDPRRTHGRTPGYEEAGRAGGGDRAARAGGLLGPDDLASPHRGSAVADGPGLVGGQRGRDGVAPERRAPVPAGGPLGARRRSDRVPRRGRLRPADPGGGVVDGIPASGPSGVLGHGGRARRLRGRSGTAAPDRRRAGGRARRPP